MSRGQGTKESGSSLPALRLMTILDQHVDAYDEVGVVISMGATRKAPMISSTW